MPYSEAQKRATMKYKAKVYEHIDLTVKKGQRDIYKAQAAAHGMSLNAYIVSLLEKDKTGEIVAEYAQPPREEESNSSSRIQTD